MNESQHKTINKGSDIKLNVKSIFVDFSHNYVYEGPCRFGQGDSLTPEYDKMLNGEIYKGFLATVKANMPDFVNLLEPIRVTQYSDDWRMHEDDMQKMLKNNDEADLILWTSSGRDNQVIIEFARRSKKPIAFYNEVMFALSCDIASLKARNLEVYPFYDWDKSRKYLKALHIKKILQNTRALAISRNSTDTSPVSAQDGFLSLEKVTDTFGTFFSTQNMHEYIDQLTNREADTNPTMPGRVQQNINDEDMIEINRIADELIDGAVECDMDREYVVNSVKVYYLTKKLLAHSDCNAFTAPCPDMCSTRRLDQEKCTLCLTHSLLEEEGIPSACEADFSILLSKVILQNLAGKSTYMGNTAWLRIVDGKLTAPDFSAVTDEEFEKIKDIPNLAVTLHSVANRKLKGYDKPLDEYALRSFAFSGWGATMRYDFSKDIDTPVTLLRINPSCDKIFVVSGKVKGQFGYTRQNCSTAILYQVNDVKDMFEKTFEFGSHMALVYGDYVEDLKLIGQVLGLEVVTA
jgi:hypothetical protein